MVVTGSVCSNTCPYIGEETGIKRFKCLTELKMYLESIAITEFCNRLSSANIKSFDGIFFVLQEFEVWLYDSPDDTKDICELRRNEIATLYDETTKQEKRSEYESFLYEEYLWGYIRGLTELAIREIKEEGKIENSESKYWEMVRTWLQRMKRKTTTITTIADSNVSSDISFNSLFQKSTDPMLSEESNLIQTMYNAFRCGMLDNPSDDAKADWLSAFDCYGILWRQCSLNGALSDSSFQLVFREVCRSFHSSNLYEQLLFSLHTTETPDDLTRILPLLHTLAHDTDTAVEEPFDALWAVSLCYQSQGAQAANDALTACRDKVIASFSTGSLAGRLLRLLLQHRLAATTELEASLQSVDDGRLFAHFLLLTHTLTSLLGPHTLPFPFAQLALLPYRLPLFHYCLTLSASMQCNCIFPYFAFFSPQDSLALFSSTLSFFFSQLTSPPYHALLADPTPVPGGDSLLQQLHAFVHSAFHFPSLAPGFCSWTLAFARKHLAHDSNDIVVLRFLFHTLGSLSAYRGVLWSLAATAFDQLASNPDCFVSVARCLLDDACLQALPTEQEWQNEEYGLRERRDVITAATFYMELQSVCLKPLFALCCEAEEKTEVEAMGTIWRAMMELIGEREEAVRPALFSALLLEWIHSMELCCNACVRRKDEAKYKELNCLLVNTLVECTSAQCAVRKYISKDLASTLAKVLVRASIGTMQDACC